jgi:hypothetical protein
MSHLFYFYFTFASRTEVVKLHKIIQHIFR